MKKLIRKSEGRIMKGKDDKKIKPRERIFNAALDLFYHRGFHQTSVRQIAEKADVNPAMISYYFKGKKGLLEQVMIQFYEPYFERIESEQQQLNLAVEGHDPVPLERLYCLVETCFNYLFENYRMTRFIYRELTVDSTLIREIMTTYLAKEKYYFLSLIEYVKKENSNEADDNEMFALQILNSLYMPFLQPQIVREVYYLEPHEPQFRDRYIKQLKKIVESCCR